MRRGTSVLAGSILLLLALAPVGQPAVAGASLGTGPLRWAEMAPMPTPRYTAAAAVTPGGTIFVLGGDNYTCTPLPVVEEYDPRTNAWRSHAAMAYGRWAHGAAVGIDGKIYVIGGQSLSSGYCNTKYIMEVDSFDPQTEEWTRRTPMSARRAGLGVVAATNGKIYAMGGTDGTSTLAIVEEYDPLTDTWSRKQDMPVPNRFFASVAATNGNIYVMGGAGYTNRVWEYDPVANAWHERPPMLTGRDMFGAAQVRGGMIYAAAGFGLTGRLSVVEESYPGSKWAPQTSIGTLTSYPVVAAVNEMVFVIGGWSINPDGSQGPSGRVERAFATR